MKASLVLQQKFIVKRRYLIEVTVHQVTNSLHYKDRLKWGLICIDRLSGQYILMDNHHPKGPHIHIGDGEIPYEFVSLDTLIEDFRRLVRDQMGVKI